MFGDIKAHLNDVTGKIAEVLKIGKDLVAQATRIADALERIAAVQTKPERRQ